MLLLLEARQVAAAEAAGESLRDVLLTCTGNLTTVMNVIYLQKRFWNKIFVWHALLFTHIL